MRRGLIVVTFSLVIAICCAQRLSPATVDSPTTTAPVESPERVLRALMSAFNRHDFAAP